MLSNKEYIMYSLEYNLFFARIMKEHLIFIESGFSIRDSQYMLEADNLKIEYEEFLLNIISLVDGNLSTEVLSSNELVTPYTLNTEILTEFFTGICINTDITKLEIDIIKNHPLNYNLDIFEEIYILNTNAINLVQRTIDFKQRVLNNVLNCKLFNRNYPLLLEHVVEEAETYLNILNALQDFDEIPVKNELVQKEVFWNEIMEEHSLFIRGLLDPTEGNLINIANSLAEEFEKLTMEAKETLEKKLPPENITKKSTKATKDIIEFKKEGTEGIINCNVKSIIVPLLADHTLREANHYLRVLSTQKAMKTSTKKEQEN